MPGKFANAAAIGEFVDVSELLHVIDTGKGGEEPPVQIELTESHHLAPLQKAQKERHLLIPRMGVLLLHVPTSIALTIHTVPLI